MYDLNLDSITCKAHLNGEPYLLFTFLIKKDGNGKLAPTFIETAPFVTKIRMDYFAKDHDCVSVLDVLTDVGILVDDKPEIEYIHYDFTNGEFCITYKDGGLVRADVINCGERATYHDFTGLTNFLSNKDLLWPFVDDLVGNWK